MSDLREWTNKLGVYKYPLAVLLLGAVLLLIPGRMEEAADTNTVEKALEDVLRDSSGVGSIRVLVSENGAVVVCSGAEMPRYGWIFYGRSVHILGWDRIRSRY